MINQINFGEKILKCESKNIKVILKKILFLIPTFIYALAGFMALNNVDEFDLSDTKIIIYIGAGIMLLYTIFIIFGVKDFEAKVYEKGLFLKKGKKITELSFDEIKGISYYCVVTIYVFIPVTQRKFTIEKKEGKELVISGVTIPNFKEFCNVVNEAYTKHIIKDLNKENIENANIYFGKSLQLDNGKFIFKKGKTVVPLKDITDFKISDEWVKFKGLNKKRKEVDLIKIGISACANISALSYIMAMVNSLEED